MKNSLILVARLMSVAIVGAMQLMQLGCSDPAPAAQLPVLSERMGLTAAPANKLPIGSDCTAYAGSSGCSSALRAS